MVIRFFKGVAPQSGFGGLWLVIFGLLNCGFGGLGPPPLPTPLQYWLNYVNHICERGSKVMNENHKS